MPADTQYVVAPLLDSDGDDRLQVLGVIFARISRPTLRSKAVQFSRYAVLKRCQNSYYFMFQCVDLRTQHSLIEAHARMYVVRDADWDPFSGRRRNLRPFPMRIQHPDDELGGMLMLNVPNVIVHRLDPWSPLVPAELLRICRDHQALTPQSGDRTRPAPFDDASSRYIFPDVLQRSADTENGSRDTKNARVTETLDALLGRNEWQGDRVIEYLRETHAEIIVLVEGIEEFTSSTVQCRWSYTPDDIRWDHDFPECVNWNRDDGCIHIDMDEFNKTVPDVNVEAAAEPEDV